MKLNPNFPSMDEILGVMRTAESGTITRLDRPETPDENLEAVESMRAFSANATAVRTLCGACGTDCAMTDTKPCVCGQFICASCEALEEEGVCAHEPPASVEAQVEAIAHEREARARIGDQAQRRITIQIAKSLDDIGVPKSVQVNIVMSLVINALMDIANVDVSAAQTLATMLAETLQAMSAAPTAQQMLMEVEKFARLVPPSEVKPS